jgi:outer membrane lipoprotein-sorting protein
MINIISLLLLSTINLNYDAAGEKLLKNLQDKFDKVKDLSADFKQSTNGKAIIN